MRVTTRGAGVLPVTAQSHGSTDSIDYTVAVEWVVEPGLAPQVTAYEIRAVAGVPIPREHRRDLEDNLEHFADRLYAQLLASRTNEVEATDATITVRNEDGTEAGPFPVRDLRMVTRYTDPASVEAEVLEEMTKRRRRRKVTPEFLAEVASVYRTHPDAPTKAVQAWQLRTSGYCSPAQASRYVRAARDAGLLPEREA